MELLWQCVPFTPPPVPHDIQGEGRRIDGGPRKADSPLVGLATTFDSQNPALGKTETVLWEVKTNRLMLVQTPHTRLTVEVQLDSRTF